MSTQEGTNLRVISTSIRLSHEEHEYLKGLAARERRSISNQIRFFIAREQEREAA